MKGGVDLKQTIWDMQIKLLKVINNYNTQDNERIIETDSMVETITKGRLWIDRAIKHNNWKIEELEEFIKIYAILESRYVTEYVKKIKDLLARLNNPSLEPQMQEIVKADKALPEPQWQKIVSDDDAVLEQQKHAKIKDTVLIRQGAKDNNLQEIILHTHIKLIEISKYNSNIYNEFISAFNYNSSAIQKLDAWIKSAIINNQWSLPKLIVFINYYKMYNFIDNKFVRDNFVSKLVINLEKLAITLKKDVNYTSNIIDSYKEDYIPSYEITDSDINAYHNKMHTIENATYTPGYKLSHYGDTPKQLDPTPDHESDVRRNAQFPVGLHI